MDKKLWNYSNILISNINNDIIFFTNNIIESFHSQLNKKFIGFCKTMFNYKNALLDVIELYEMKNKYTDKKISLTRALMHYVKSRDTFDLITHKEISHIKSNYKEFLKSNQLPLDQLISDNESDKSDDYYNKQENNYYTSEDESSSDSGQEDIKEKTDVNRHDDDSDDNYEDKDESEIKNNGKGNKKESNSNNNNYNNNKNNKKNNRNKNCENIDFYNFKNEKNLDIIYVFHLIKNIDDKELKNYVNENSINYRLKLRKDFIFDIINNKRKLLSNNNY